MEFLEKKKLRTITRKRKAKYDYMMKARMLIKKEHAFVLSHAPSWSFYDTSLCCHWWYDEFDRPNNII